MQCSTYYSTPKLCLVYPLVTQRFAMENQPCRHCHPHVYWYMSPMDYDAKHVWIKLLKMFKGLIMCKLCMMQETEPFGFDWKQATATVHSLSWCSLSMAFRGYTWKYIRVVKWSVSIRPNPVLYRVPSHTYGSGTTTIWDTTPPHQTLPYPGFIASILDSVVLYASFYQNVCMVLPPFFAWFNPSLISTFSRILLDLSSCIAIVAAQKFPIFLDKSDDKPIIHRLNMGQFQKKKLKVHEDVWFRPVN